MKRFALVILSVCVLLCAFCFSSLAAKTGDVDGDNTVKAGDARLILRAAVGLEKFDAVKTLLGDIDFDGKLTAGDARLALRGAVGLEKVPSKAYANEYEAFADGHFSADITGAIGEYNETMALAVTEDSIYTGMDMEGMSLTDLMNSKGQYLIFDKEKIYSPLSDDFLAAMGMTKDDLKEIDSLAGTYRPLSEANSTSSGTVDDISCTVYTFRYDGYFTDVYMNGKKLMAIVDYNDSYKEETFFENFSVYVPAERYEVPADYTAESIF